MSKYETVIHIVTTGEDLYDAGEKAGQLLTDKLTSEKDFYIFCETTKPYFSQQELVQKSSVYAV
jgi:hypothetical protein